MARVVLLAVGVLAAFFCFVFALGAVMLGASDAGLIGIGVGGLAFLIAVWQFRRALPMAGGIGGVGSTAGPYPANVPDTRNMDGLPYTVLYTPPKTGRRPEPSQLQVSAPVCIACEFQIVRETAFDRWAKRSGLAVEIQTGDEVFDGACYVRSDHPAFAAAYLADPVKRGAILEMRRLGFSDLTLKNGELSVVRPGFDPAKDDRPNLAADAAAQLVLMGRKLPSREPAFDESSAGRRKAWLWVLWSLLAVFNTPAVFLPAYLPMSPWEAVAKAAGVTVLGLLAFAALAAVLLRGTSTSHLTWGRLVLWSAVLFPAGAFTTVVLVNGATDTSPEVVHDLMIVGKYTTSGGKGGGKGYHVTCASWRSPGDTESFSVASSDYDAIVPSRSHLSITTRAGALGVEWVVSRAVHQK